MRTCGASKWRIYTESSPRYFLCLKVWKYKYMYWCTALGHSGYLWFHTTPLEYNKTWAFFGRGLDFVGLRFKLREMCICDNNHGACFFSQSCTNRVNYIYLRNTWCSCKCCYECDMFLLVLAVVSRSTCLGRHSQWCVRGSKICIQLMLPGWAWYVEWKQKLF